MEIMSLIAMVVGPIVAVVVTLFWQGRKEKRDAKERLFLTLMAHRQSFPPSPELVNALNVVDVVFADIPQVVDLWHQYYNLLCNSSPSNRQQNNHTYLLMLSAMARSLGYKRIEQTDIDKFYCPQAHVDQMTLNGQCQAEWLRVLQNTARFSVEQRQPEQGSAQEVKT